MAASITRLISFDNVWLRVVSAMTGNPPLMHSENAPNYIFSMFEAFCEDIKLDKRNFDERYGKSFFEAIDNFEASVSIG